LSIAGTAEFSSLQQFYIDEEFQTETTASNRQSVTGMGGLVSDAQIISHNDFADRPYRSGDWLLLSRINLGGSTGVSTISMTNITVDILSDSGQETFRLANQTRTLELKNNFAPTATLGPLVTGSREMLVIKPVLHDANPQDLETISLIIKRYPIQGTVLVSPVNPQEFIYHPPQNGTFSGTTSFEFALTDGTAESPTYTANITVNNAPQFTGIPDYIDCDRSAELSLRIQVEDADTPADQLVFSLQNAPDWLSVSNQNDYTAIISGTPKIAGNFYQVCTVSVYDPLSLVTSRVTLLLLFDPNAGGIVLTVVNGSGGGLFDVGVVTQIRARDSNGQDGFIGWTGDIQYLDDSQSPTPTVTIPNHDLTLTAAFAALKSQSYADWIEAFGITTDGDGVTPANDGISNIKKYAAGLSPYQAYSQSALFSCKIERGAVPAEDRFVVRYQKSKQASEGVITPVCSSSLLSQEWDEAPITRTLIYETDTLEFWEASLPLDAAPTMFIKLIYEIKRTNQ
jgi:hypothetical protein